MSVFAMPSVDLPCGETIPALGMGTWNLAEGRHPRKVEIEALRAGIDLGMTLVDTAELYAHGESERLVGEAIAGRRGEVFLVGKVRPGRATREGAYDACAESLARLATDQFDLYLLHWRGSVPLVCAAKMSCAYAAGPDLAAQSAEFFSSQASGFFASFVAPMADSATTASAVLP